MTAIAAAETAMVAKFADGKAATSAGSFSRNSRGSSVMVRPRTAEIWLAAMMTAMPAVNPTMTG